MQQASDVVAISITFHFNNKPCMFILLGSDGCIHRMGNPGTNLGDMEGELFIGQTDLSVFEAVRSMLSELMLAYSGGYQHPQQRGKPCELRILFRFADQTEGGFSFLYTSESEGPPPEVVNFVLEAARLTEPWYDDYKQKVRAARYGADDKR